MTHIWQARYGEGRPDLRRCRAAVHEGGRGVGFYQCSRKATVTREVGGVDCGFCGQHDPDVVAERKVAREAQWRAESARRDAQFARQRAERVAREGCIDALRQIEAGHNDPRTLAKDALAALDDAQGIPTDRPRREAGSVHG